MIHMSVSTACWKYCRYISLRLPACWVCVSLPHTQTWTDGTYKELNLEIMTIFRTASRLVCLGRGLFSDKRSHSFLGLARCSHINLQHGQTTAGTQPVGPNTQPVPLLVRSDPDVPRYASLPCCLSAWRLRWTSWWNGQQEKLFCFFTPQIVVYFSHLWRGKDAP